MGQQRVVASDFGIVAKLKMPRWNFCSITAFNRLAGAALAARCTAQSFI
jgi:hypothetical protein